MAPALLHMYEHSAAAHVHTISLQLQKYSRPAEIIFKIIKFDNNLSQLNQDFYPIQESYAESRLLPNVFE